MSEHSVGYISSKINKKAVLVIIALFLTIIIPLSYKSWRRTSVECIKCHSSKKLMEKLGTPYLYMTAETVEKQSKHKNIGCIECHLGNGRSKDKDIAHKDMLKALLVGESGKLLKRQDYYKGPIMPTGENKIYELLPKIEEDGQTYVPFEFRNLLWHDRNSKTYNFDPEIAQKTCAKSNCHPQQLEQFTETIMGTNYRQRYMETWLKPYGPHNCGPSFADLPSQGKILSTDFSFKNTEEIRKNLNVPFTNEQAVEKQKFCNVCHAGCLDCHYSPNEKEGVHFFSRLPDSITCSGGGRGTSICHPGAMQSRRGETYIGGDYSVPSGMKPDVHYKKDIHCIACHQTGEKGMGDIQRKADCQDCHLEIEDAHKTSAHKNLDCASCHINELRGYQITVWGPGAVSHKANPFKKYSLYYGIQKPPILVKDQNKIWRPYKIWPHSVGNYKDDAPPSPSLQFRWQKAETNDAYYIVGTFDNLPDNNKHLLWLQLDQASHPYGKARICADCHSSSFQQSESSWEFFDNYGAEPFNGQHKIIADANSLRITDMENTTPISLMDGSNLSDFASWIYLKDKWSVPGDFSIKTDRGKYSSLAELSKKIEIILNFS
ncbi:cytochrome c family protein [Candidatus Magnetoovum chiemensis]|nr:cytochrome c family protein [Candidatus Magnetoovum chiemensis]